MRVACEFVRATTLVAANFNAKRNINRTGQYNSWWLTRCVVFMFVVIVEINYTEHSTKSSFLWPNNNHNNSVAGKTPTPLKKYIHEHTHTRTHTHAYTRMNKQTREKDKERNRKTQPNDFLRRDSDWPQKMVGAKVRLPAATSHTIRRSTTNHTKKLHQ